MALYLGAKHPIILADGSVVPIGNLIGTTTAGIGWFVNEFRKQDITIAKCNRSTPLWKVVSKSGREISCADNTYFLASVGRWEKFCHRPNRKRIHRINIDIQSINYLPVYGTRTEDQMWIDVVSHSMRACSLKYPHSVRVSKYFCHLNSETLESLMYAIRDRFSISLPKKLDISSISYHDQQLLFHLFDRTKRIRCTSKGSSRVMTGIQDGKKSCHVRPTRSAKTTPKDQTYLCKDKLACYYEDTSSQEIVIVNSQFGNIVDKSFICQT